MLHTHASQPQRVGDEVTDKDGTWKITEIVGSTVHWKLVKPAESPHVSKSIELHIQPEFTAWRRQLVRNIPIVMMSNSKGYYEYFFKPISAFIREHGLEDATGQFMIDPFTDNVPRLRLLYMLFLLYKTQLRLFRTHGPREPENHEQMLATAEFTAAANREQEEHLTARIDELEEELAELHSNMEERHTLFDSDSDEQ